MPILASISWIQSPTFNLQRQYMDGWVIGWWDFTTVVSYGQTTIIQNIPVGSYRVVIKFKDWWWNWDNRAANCEDILEDFYACTISDPTPINAGNVTMGYQFAPQFKANLFTIDFLTSEFDYWLFGFPPAVSAYWKTSYNELPALPHHIT